MPDLRLQYGVLYVLIIIHTNKECRIRRKATSYYHLRLIPKQLFWDANSLAWFSTFQGAGFNLTKHFVKREISFNIWLFLEFQVIFHFLKMPILFIILQVSGHHLVALQIVCCQLLVCRYSPAETLRCIIIASTAGKLN